MASFAGTALEERPDLGRNLTHGLMDVLGSAIVKGEFDDGAFPTEAELANRHGVCRSVTREAVKMLVAKGMIAAWPRKGIRIQPVPSWNLFDPEVMRWLFHRGFSGDLLRQFDQLRIAIEPEAAALAARCADAGDLTAIEGALHRLADAPRQASDPLAAAAQFHGAILRASKNPFYERFAVLITMAMKASQQRGRHADPYPDIHGNRAKVFHAICTKNPQAASAAMHALISAETVEPRATVN